jgi:hypothetical protein
MLCQLQQQQGPLLPALFLLLRALRLHLAELMCICCVIWLLFLQVCAPDDA